MATEEVNVSTIEDPIEMIEPSFNQTQVQTQLEIGQRPDFQFSSFPVWARQNERRTPEDGKHGLSWLFVVERFMQRQAVGRPLRNTLPGRAPVKRL